MNCIEKNNHNDSCKTPIQRFYAGQSVFITGGTGFLGKVLIEKLLRNCSDISKIYLLIRSKNNQNSQMRLNELFKSPLYDRLKEEMPHFRNKIVPIIGDLHVNGLGLSESDKNILKQEVSIIFHVAATVRFNEKIKVSTIVNVTATVELFNIIKYMTNLKSFIHVSTLYSQYHLQHIEEKFYTTPIDYKSLIALTNDLPEKELDRSMAKISTQWKNNYLFTKAVAESFFKSESGNLPIGIFRPCIVLCSADEPVKGWIENSIGLTWLLIVGMLGIMRFYYCDVNVRPNIVPVDITINALIASAWDVFNQKCRRGNEMLIYNSVPKNILTVGDIVKNWNILCKKYPSNNIRWLPHTICVRQKTIYKICILLFHMLPAFLLDMTRRCMGLQPRLLKLYRKLYTTCEIVSPFSLREYIVDNDNVEKMWNNMSEADQQMYKFDMKKFDWLAYLAIYYKGIRCYLLNEDDSASEINHMRYKRFYWMNQIIVTIFILGVLWILWKIFVNVLFNNIFY